MNDWKNNDILQSNFKTFDEKNCQQILKLEYDIEWDHNGFEVATLKLRLLYSHKDTKKYVDMKFCGLESLKIDGSLFPFLQVMGFQIINQREYGLEKVYEISDYEDGNIYFTCDDIEVIGVSNLE
ncbi:hypothetical protein [Listeria rocourtiae]|uniref:hypothetical protein n=1 Tax=Listeria rocourtiae TaxID=647910 RepID=UPI003D2F756F